ncbi:50S ribosomal protein L24 [Candidatus Peregrinibacteria bacterium]|nr:50S ribosomal protein L24 [Candidatus Peregrinibacteria bacterium]
MKLKVNDQVAIISGKDKGKKGKIMRTLGKSGKVVVEKVNMRTKHIKKTKEKSGERITFEAPMDASNVIIICPNCEKRTRIAIKKLENGKKQRTCKKCKESVDKSVQTKK